MKSNPVKYFLILFFIGSIFCKEAKCSTIRINTKITGASTEPVYILEHNPISQEDITLAAGRESLIFECKLPCVLSLLYKTDKITLFLEEEGDMSILFHPDSIMKTLHFSGANRYANNYLLLQRKLSEQLKPKEMIDFYGLDQKSFIKLNDNIYSAQHNAFKEYFKNKKTSNSFSVYVKSEIKYQNAINKVLYPQYHRYFTKEVIDSGNVYFHFPQHLIPERAMALLSPSYVDFISLYLDEKVRKIRPQSPIQDIKDLQKSYLKQKRQFVDKLIVQAPVNAFFSAMIFFQYLNFGFIDDYEHIIQSDSSIHMNQYFPLVEERAAALKHLSTGKRAPAFKFKDQSGKEHSLDEYTGRRVLINVWSSSCHFSLEEIPYYSKLVDEYKDKVVFINMTNEPLTKDKISFIQHMPDFKGIHGYAGGIKSEFDKLYFINNTPRFILINTDGTIADAYAPRPSTPGLKKILSAN